MVFAEIQYGQGIHSDLDPDDRETLHRALDEWLNKADGSGFFYVGSHKDLSENFD